MESRHTRRLSTVLVGIGITLGTLCLLVGTVLHMASDAASAADRALAAQDIAAGLAAGDARAWLSLGALLIILTPSLRLAGMLGTFTDERTPRAFAAAAVVLITLLVALTGALRATPEPPPPTRQDE